MLINLIVANEDRLQIETFDVDVRTNRICKLNASNKGSYLRNLNDYILKDIAARRIVAE
jgi:hypothetical protein